MELDYARIIDAGLMLLKGLTKLDWLDLHDTKITDAGVQKLQQALPNCEIHQWPQAAERHDHRPTQPIQAPPPLVSIQPADAVCADDGAPSKPRRRQAGYLAQFHSLLATTSQQI